jgi:hypothetical protein
MRRLLQRLCETQQLVGTEIGDGKPAVIQPRAIDETG